MAKGAKHDFELTWTPRIGEDAARAFWFYDRVVGRGYLVAVVGTVAGVVLIGRGNVGTIAGVMCISVIPAYAGMYAIARIRIHRALTKWFGVRLSDIPKNPVRFDAWAKAHDLKSPDKRAAEASSGTTDRV